MKTMMRLINIIKTRIIKNLDEMQTGISSNKTEIKNNKIATTVVMLLIIMAIIDKAIIKKMLTVILV